MQDSGMSDSEFMKTQKLMQNKNKEYMKELYEQQEREALLSKFSKARQSGKTQSLWQRFKRWISEQ